MPGFTTHDPHDQEWETGPGLATTFSQDDEDYCPTCDEFFFDDEGTGHCEVCGEETT